MNQVQIGFLILSHFQFSRVSAAMLLSLFFLSPVQSQTRVEFHLLPAVSTGPLDPAWSPDGKWITFSMRGDIWKIPRDGGEAVALTQGPGYYFEPSWSPDGEHLAVSLEQKGNLDIGLVHVDGGVRRLTDHPEVDVQPVWGPDGSSLYFVSGRRGNLDIYHLEVATGKIAPVVSSAGNEFHPAVSGDGNYLAYVAPVQDRPGTGGIWLKPLPVGSSRLIHYEETSYRTRPVWSPDGTSLIYVSDVTGSNNLAIIPVEGGVPVGLTEDPMDELSPAFNHNGSTIAFVSNHRGPTTLYSVSSGGGPRESWKEIAILSRRSRRETGWIRGRVLGPEATPVPARILLTAGDGRSYCPDGAFHRKSWLTGEHYFHTTGEFEVEVPAGEVTIEALKGFEFHPTRISVQVPGAGKREVELNLRRLVNPRERGWFSGDMHVHDLHQGRFGLTHENFFLQLEAEDVAVTNALIHMDGTKLMGRWEDLSGTVHPLSTNEHILYYSQEFRGSFGHLGLVGIKRFITPLIAGLDGTAFSSDILKMRYFRETEEQGGVSGYLHPYNHLVDEPSLAASADIPLHAALGQGDFYDVISAASQELPSAEIYYKLINCGFLLAATGGTDNFSDVWLDPAPGAARTYARIEGPLSFQSWIASVKAGRTMATNGPLLFLEVNGRKPGDEIVVNGKSNRFSVRVKVASIVPLDRVEILVNGEVARTFSLSGLQRIFERETRVELSGGWIAARALGPANRFVDDEKTFAQTSPVYILENGELHRSPQSARFLREAVEELWRRVESRNRWQSSEERQQYGRAIERAREVYRNIESSKSQPPRFR